MIYLYYILKWALNSITLILLLITVTVILLYNTTTSEKLANRLVNHTKNRYDLTDFHANVTSLTPTEFALTNIHVNDPEKLKIDSITLHYYPSQLYFNKTLKHLTIDGASFILSAENGTINWGNIVPFIHKVKTTFSEHNKSDTSTFRPTDFPIATINIRDALLTINTDEDTLTFPFSLEITKQETQLSATLHLEKSAVLLNNITFAEAGTLSVDSEISGTIPLSWDGESLTITNGCLSTNRSGSVQFISSLPLQDENMKLLMKALKNFTYSAINITLNTMEDKRLQAAIALEGKNIDVYGERDINLNVNVFIDVLKTIKSIMGVQTLSDKFSESLTQKKEQK